MAEKKPSKKLDDDKSMKPIEKESKRSMGGGKVVVDDPDEDITKVPVAKLRVAQSTTAVESSEEEMDTTLGGYSKTRQRRESRLLQQKMKDERRGSKTGRVDGRSSRVKSIFGLLGLPVKGVDGTYGTDGDLPSAVGVPVERKKVKLLGEIDYEDTTDFVYYQNPKTRVFLIFVFILTEAFGVAFLTLVPIYSILESGNVELYLTRGYKRRGKTIHYTIGALYVFILGNGFIIFRITSAYKGTVLKWLHALTYTCAIPLPLYCINAYYLVKTENRSIHIEEHYYSLHSFFGFLAIYIHIFEVCCGTIVYTIFLFRTVHRNIYYQVHTYVGLFGFLLAISTFCLGITMEVNDIKQKIASPHENILFYLNLSGIFICIFAAFALFLIINPDFDVEKDILAYKTTTKPK